MGIFSRGLYSVLLVSKAQDSVLFDLEHYNGMCFDHVQSFVAHMFSDKVAGI
jgi:hypothetical protein